MSSLLLLLLLLLASALAPCDDVTNSRSGLLFDDVSLSLLTPDAMAATNPLLPGDDDDSFEARTFLAFPGFDPIWPHPLLFLLFSLLFVFYLCLCVFVFVFVLELVLVSTFPILFLFLFL